MMSQLEIVDKHNHGQDNDKIRILLDYHNYTSRNNKLIQ